MSEPFIAEIRIFGGNFAPRGWALCDGQLLPIAQNTALFSLIGTIYGGDGRTTTALPNMKGRAPMHAGNGPGLTSRRIGQVGGVEDDTLTEAQLPSHNHAVMAAPGPGEQSDPDGNALGRSVNGNAYAPPGPQVPLANDALPATGGGSPHNSMQPFLTMNFIIALEGLYPSRA